MVIRMEEKKVYERKIKMKKKQTLVNLLKLN